MPTIRQPTVASVAAVEKLYVLGHPVAHSKSPAMHNAALQALGLHWEYGFMDCATESDAQVFLNARAWRACNVTMPWKPLAYRYADRCSIEATLGQGANVLLNWGKRVHAHNVDGIGCASYLQRCGVHFDGARVVVCGTGPTSLAIAHACADRGANCVSLLGRNLEKTRQVVASYEQRLGRASVLEAGSYDEAGHEAIAAADVVADATPLGMNPGDPAPFDTGVLSAGQTVFDVVYGHGETALVAGARAAGCDVYDGSGMLVAQAVETLRFVAETTQVFDIPAHLDLFSVMAKAADFNL